MIGISNCKKEHREPWQQCFKRTESISSHPGIIERFNLCSRVGAGGVFLPSSVEPHDVGIWWAVTVGNELCMPAYPPGRGLEKESSQCQVDSEVGTKEN